MSAEEFLESNERSASKTLSGGDGDGFKSNVNGTDSKLKTSKKSKSKGVVRFLVLAMFVFGAFVFLSGNFEAVTLSENLIEQTDVQYADNVESKIIVLAQTLKDGTFPQEIANTLKEKGILVGSIQGGSFVEGIEEGVSLVLNMNGEIITADNFYEKVNTSDMLYSAIEDATYKRAAGYYDEAAMEVFKEIGSSRNNYTADSDLGEVMDSIMGDGNSVDVNSVSLVEKTRQNSETGETETYFEYVANGQDANTKSGAATFISGVASKNLASNSNEATLNSADALKVADTMSKEQRSSLFYVLFMENISKMKAGDGNESKINEAMNYLYEKAETEVVDVKTGEVKKIVGTALDSPSLYAILTGSKVNLEEIENYSSDRILKTVENQLDSNGNRAIAGTVASSTNKTKGSIGRFISEGIEAASDAILSLVEPTINNSMINNSYSDIKGIGAGETLAEGAVNVGAELAEKSGATSGDMAAVTEYGRLNSTVLAMEARVDRMNRSPFDITSKNTFLGSIIYNFAVASMKFAGVWSGVKTFSSTVSSAVASLLPTSYADEADGYLMNFGDCETYASIGAVGSASCARNVTFDTSTLNDPYNDFGFINFINNNTTLDSSGVRKINENSVLANFILYNNERITPLGVVDGGILDSLSDSSSSIPFLSDIVKMIEIFEGASEDDKRIATGEAFVNSSANPDWQAYKYAQRYVSLARATAMLRQFSDDKTAYNNIRFFEGNRNPVVAFLEEYHTVANNN